MKKRLHSFLKTFLVVLCVCVMAFSAWQLYAGEQEYQRGDDLYGEVLDTANAGYMAVYLPAEEPGATPEPIVIPDIDFEALSQVNVEGLAWIYCPDSMINYPVVQGEDNKFYLNHLIDGKRNRNGTIFLDYRNAPDFTDHNSVLYGHHMRSGKMFAGIEKYKKQEHFDEHPYMYLVTATSCYRVELFAGIVKDASDITLTFTNDAAFLIYVAGLYERSTFKSPVEVGPEDRLLTLSTCTYDFKNARYTLIGKLRQVW